MKKSLINLTLSIITYILTPLIPIFTSISSNITWFENLESTCNIGTINYNDQLTIKNKFYDYLQSKNIALDDFEIISITNIKYNSADITLYATKDHIVNDKVIKVNFKTKEIDLKNIITNNNLENIEDNSANVIHQALQEKNKDLEKIESEIKIIEIKDTSALVITGKNIENYNLNKPIDTEKIVKIYFNTNNYLVNTFINDTKLGILPNNNSETIRNKIKEKNRNFSLNSFNMIMNDSPNNYNNSFNIITLQGNYKPKVVHLILTKQNFYRPATEQEIKDKKDKKSKEKIIYSKNENSIKLSFFLKTKEEKTYKVVNNYTKSTKIKPGYVYYVGVGGKVYLKNNKGKILGKFEGIENQVIDIKLYAKGIIIVATNKGEVYSLLDNWQVKKIDNIESTDLNKWISLFYNKNKEAVELTKEWWQKNKPHNIIVKTFNLGSLNPLNYKFIEFKGPNENYFSNTRVSWKNDAFGGAKNLFTWTKNKSFDLKKIIKNSQITQELLNSKEFSKQTPWLINSGKIESFLANIEYEQTIGLNFYWEKDNYYLQVLVHQQCEPNFAVTSGGAMFFFLGNEIRLYN